MESDADSLINVILGKAQESETIEFKDRKTLNKDDIGKYFSALSNEARLNRKDAGWIVFGIDDDGAITGSNYLDTIDSQNELKRYIFEQTSNHMSFVGIYEREVSQKRILVLEIPPSMNSTPTKFKGFAYGREGESLVPLSDEKRLRIESIDSRDWSANVIHGRGIEILDGEALEYARKRFANARRSMASECKTWSDESFLDKMGLRVDGLLTYAAVILLGDEEHSHLAKGCNPYIKKTIRDERNIVRASELFGTPFVLSVDEICRQIRNIPLDRMDERTLSVERDPTYDPALLREALYNAIGHQDYSKSGYITVTEHEYDRLIITNAGTFLPGDTRTAVEMDRPPIHYRNGCLMNALYKMGFVETAGGGIMRMCMSQAERGFPMPDYRSDGLGVELTIHGKNPAGPYSEILRRNPGLSALEIVDLDYVRMGKTIPKLDERSLESKGLVRRTSDGLTLVDPDMPSTTTIGYAGVKTIRPMIIDIIRINGESTKKEILDIISPSLDGNLEKIYNDVTNALSSLRKEGVIENIGTSRLQVYRMNAPRPE